MTARRIIGLSGAAAGPCVVACVLVALILIPAATKAGGLSEAERRGKDIYSAGRGRGPITAHLAGPGVTAPGTAFPCSSCHRADGAGVKEGGVRSADIAHATLTKEFQGVRPSGRAHPPYTDRRDAKSAKQN
jgi:hypothetical protein